MKFKLPCIKILKVNSSTLRGNDSISVLSPLPLVILTGKNSNLVEQILFFKMALFKNRLHHAEKQTSSHLLFP